MAWVTFEGKLYCLPTQTRFNETEFRTFQETNRGREVRIYAPEGGNSVVPMLELKYAESEFSTTIRMS